METNNIISELQSYKRRSSFYYLSKFDKTSRITGILITLIIIMLFSLIIEHPAAKLSALIILFIGILITAGLLIKEYRNPVRSKLVQANGELEKQAAIASKISVSSSESINICISWLENDIERLKSYSGFLIGSIEKLGLIPALIGLYLAYANITKQEPITNIVDFIKSQDPAALIPEMLLIAFIVGVYAGAFRLKLIINGQHDAILILSHAKLLAQDRESND